MLRLVTGKEFGKGNQIMIQLVYTNAKMLMAALYRPRFYLPSLTGFFWNRAWSMQLIAMK